MNVSGERTVRELALELPNATRVFESMGIDYCCGGAKSLREACAKAKLPVQDALAKLQQAAEDDSGPVRDDWSAAPMSDLIHHIVDKHHRFTREEIARLQPLFEKVCSVHGKNHPELFDMQQTFRGLAEELNLHMMKEERILFPYIIRMEESVLQKESVVPPPFGTVQNPVRTMALEHDSAGDALARLRETSGTYNAPVDACISFRTLYRALEGFEADLHQHIHLENNVLFPQAIGMEESLCWDKMSTVKQATEVPAGKFRPVRA
jgi:regulator of cell morphogenesis and NO signaling